MGVIAKRTRCLTEREQQSVETKRVHGEIYIKKKPNNIGGDGSYGGNCVSGMEECVKCVKCVHHARQELHDAKKVFPKMSTKNKTVFFVIPENISQEAYLIAFSLRRSL